MTESTLPSTASAGPEPWPAQFVWRGRPLSKEQVAWTYLGLSTVILAVGVFLNYVLTQGHWYSGDFSSSSRDYLQAHPYDLLSGIILVTSLAFLGSGYFWRDRRAHLLRVAGFATFGFYWGMQAMRLYVAEGGDFVNAIFAGFAVFFFNYFAYHEIVSYRRNEDPRPLQWLAGTSFITTGVYFLTHKVGPIANWLILEVAKQTNWLLNAFGQGTLRDGGDPSGSQIYYPYDAAQPYGSSVFPIQIILACTAIQSIMIFVGGIAALKPPRMGDGVSGKPGRFDRLIATYQSRRMWALLLTVPLIWVLNLFRNVIIIWMSGQEHPVLFATNESAFWFSHNVIGKGGSLVALIIIAFIVFQILPELYDSIIGLLDLKKRRGPLETWFGEHFGRRQKRPALTTSSAFSASPTSASNAPQPIPPDPLE